MTARDLLEGQVRRAETLPRLAQDLERMAGAVVLVFRRRGRLWLAGNGGSAALAAHLAAEFAGGFGLRYCRLPALSLMADPACLTALANDGGWEGALARLLEAVSTGEDALLVLSASGRSANLVNASRRARLLRLPVFALTGPAPNPLADEADVALAVPDEQSVPRIQESHLCLGHALCELVLSALSS